MKITNLMDNIQGNASCLFEHGLSFYIETEKHKVLVDCGQSHAFIQNAEVLGIDLQEVDTIILSHGHYDHSGGILPFTEINNHALIYMQKTAILPYYHKSDQEERYIGIDPKILKLAKIGLEEGALQLEEEVLPVRCVDSEVSIEDEHSQIRYVDGDVRIEDGHSRIGFVDSDMKIEEGDSRIRFVEGDLQMDEELALFAGVKGRVLWPKGNLELVRKTDAGFVQDTFDHEQYLVVTEGDKKVLFSGCAHNGILNILNHYFELYGSYPYAVFSGFHMKKREYTEEDDTLITETAKQLAKMPTKFYTGHCTGEYAFAQMKEMMGKQLVYVRSGDEVLL